MNSKRDMEDANRADKAQMENEVYKTWMEQATEDIYKVSHKKR